MSQFTIIETDEGLEVAVLEPGTLPDDVAIRHHGLVVDPGPYKTFDDAYDAILALSSEEDEDEAE
jgi:hypothetical protein